MGNNVKRRFYLKEFKAISQAVSTYEDLNLLMSHVVEGLCRAFKIKGSCIMLYDDREKQLFDVASYGISDEYLNKGPILVDDKYAAFLKGEPVFIDNLQNDPRMQYPEAAVKEGIVTMMSFPLKCRDTVIGLLRAYHSEPITLHEEDIDSIDILLHQLGMVIENKGLRNFLESVKMSLGNLPLRMLTGL